MTRARLFPLIPFLASAALLLGALGFQYIGGLFPCQLCLWQRWPHLAVVIIAGVAILIARRTPSVWLLLLLAFVFALSAAIAGFHAGVEQKWWAGLPGCSGAADFTKLTPGSLGEAVTSKPAPRCDDIPWSLLGISMAGYNFLISAALTIYSLWSALSLKRGG